MLSGYKTYLGAIALFILGGLKALNVIDDHTFQAGAAILAAWTAAALRSAMNTTRK